MLFDKILLEADEKIIATVRKHWFVIGVEIGVIILFGLLPVFILLGFLSLPPSSVLADAFELRFPYLMFGVSGWLLLSTIAATTAWTHYFLDLWVITDRRIILIDQVHFFNRKVSNFRLERLQDIKVSVNGVIPTLLNFGTIRAQTASAAESNFTATGLPAPRELQALIQTAMDARLSVLGGTHSMAD